MDVMDAASQAARKITYEEFLNRCDEWNAAEWVDGEVTHLTVSAEHCDLNGWLIAILRVFLEYYQLGRAFSDPFNMKTGPSLPGRAPDVCVLVNEHLGRLRKNHIEGPADLVIEIVSPDSIGRDRGDKYVEYETGGVQEYWIIDPVRKQAEFCLRGKDGFFHPAFADGAGIYRSLVITDLWVDVAWFWRKPLPATMEVLSAWKLV